MKKWYQSKTVNANVVAILGAITAYLQGGMDESTAISAVLMGLVNIALRFVTSSAIGSEVQE